MSKLVFKKFTEEDLRNAISSNYSISSVLKQLGIVAAGGNYKTIHRKIDNLGINTDHFTGQGHLKGKVHNWSKKTLLSEILVENYSGGVGSYKLKNRLLKEGLLEAKCYNCKSTTWMNVPIPLELEHINGKNTDNRIENLTLLCPNCHALTSTYRAKNKAGASVVPRG